MNDAYSPHTGEHIASNNPAAWMGRAGVPAPEYNAKTHGCFWLGDAWEIVAGEPKNTPVPAEVPRWAGLLAIKRHAVVGAELTQLQPNDDGATSIFTTITAFREAMPPGEDRDRLDVALDHAKDWTRASPTVASMADVARLTSSHLDALFRWADQQTGTV